MSAAADRAVTADAARIKLEASWRARVGAYLERAEMLALSQFLRSELRRGTLVYPPPKRLFAALEATPFDQVKIVILGQDPYHGPNQAHGLCFSVLPGVAVPPSLHNIFAEIERDLGLPRPAHGCLLPWARQGVLLLNATLSVQAGVAGSHQGKGWEGFTDAIVDELNRERDGLVFLLWGSYAQAKGKLIDTDRHLVLKAPHPSPLSAYRGFIGCGHFSLANKYLREHGRGEIDWRLPSAADIVVE
jgi:uracil-DNA glycosylase